MEKQKRLNPNKKITRICSECGKKREGALGTFTNWRFPQGKTLCPKCSISLRPYVPKTNDLIG